MRKVLKIGDPVYSQSIKHFTPSAIEVFPQREQHLLVHVKGLQLEVFKHQVLSSIEMVARERDRLSDFIKGQELDYLMVDNPLSALLIDREIKVPILFDCIDWYDEIYLKEFGVGKGYHLLRYGLLDLLERAEKVIAQSPVILEALKSWGLKTKRAVVIPNGFDSRIFFPFDSAARTKVRGEIEKRHGFEIGDRKVIVYTGKLSAWSDGILVVADAITDDQIFLVVGEGPLLDKIPDAANIIKCGAVDSSEVSDYTNLADILVFPVASDCSPIVISEYLAVGKPIVMPKGRIEWLLKDGDTGFMVDNNVYSWKNGIKRALLNQEKIGARNAEKAKQLSWQNLARQFTQFVLEQ
jgi:glycosyltransferase involved in cell wall biosynthesis